MSDLVIRRVWHADLDELVALHRRIVEDLPSTDLYVGHDADWFERHILAEGICLGAFDARSLVGYGIMRFPGSAPENLGDVLGLPSAERTFVTQVQGAGVAPGYRGRGLQSELLRRRLIIAQELGYRHVCASVSPRNVPSLSNLMRHGLAIVATLENFAGYERLIVYRDLHKNVRSKDATDLRLVKLHDAAALRAAIADGFVGSILAASAVDHQVLMIRGAWSWLWSPENSAHDRTAA